MHAISARYGHVCAVCAHACTGFVCVCVCVINVGYGHACAVCTCMHGCMCVCVINVGHGHVCAVCTHACIVGVWVCDQCGVWACMCCVHT